jgi:WD40 repeat protein
MVPETRDLIEKIKFTDRSSSSELKRLGVTLTDPNDAEWLAACKQAVFQRNKEWLGAYAYAEDDNLPWPLDLMKRTERNIPSVTRKVAVARSIAASALSALLLRVVAEKADASLVNELSTSLYQAVLNWQPEAVRKVARLLQPTDELRAAIDTGLQSKLNFTEICRRALRVIQKIDVAWEVAPIFDLITFFDDSDAEIDSWDRAMTVTVVLDCGDQGLVATLQLEKRSNGFGRLYRHPLTMAFVRYDEEFTDSLSDAWKYAISESSLANQSDVRWQLKVWEGARKRRPLPEYILGGSIGAGCALGLLHLFKEYLPALDSNNWAITGRVTKAGDITSVSGYEAKLEAIEPKRYLGMIVPEADLRELNPRWSHRLRILKGATTVKTASKFATGETERRRRRLKRAAGVAAASVLFGALVISIPWGFAQSAERKRAESLRDEAVAAKGVADEQREEASQQRQRAEVERQRATENEAAAVKQKGEADRQRQIAEVARSSEQQQRLKAEEQRKLAELAKDEEQRQREKAEQQRQLAETARAEEERQRKRAEQLEKRASAQRQSAVARQVELQGDKAMAGNDPASAQLLYAKALTLDDRLTTRTRLLLARARPFLKLSWLAGVDYQSAPLAVSPDGQLMAIGKQDSSIELRNTITGQGTLVLVNERSTEISSLCFSPDGQHLAAASTNGLITLWDYRTGKQVKELRPTDESTNKTGGTNEAEKSDEDEEDDSGYPLLAYSRDGQKLAMGFSARDNRILIWDVTSGKVLSTIFHPSLMLVSLHFDQHNNLITAGPLGDVFIRSLDSNLVSFLSHNVKLQSSAISRDGSFFATAGDNLIRIWDLKTRRQVIPTPLNHPAVNTVAFSVDGLLLASAGSDGTIKLWDTSSGKEILNINDDLKDIDNLVLTQNGNLLAQSNEGNTIKSWSITPGPAALPFGRKEGTTADVSFSHDGSKIASIVFADGVVSGSIRIWDVQRRQLSRQIGLDQILTTAVRGATGEGDAFYLPPITVRFSPDDRYVALGGLGPDIPVFDVQTGQPLPPFAHGKSDEIHYFVSIAFSPAGNLLAAAVDDGTIHIWDAKTRNELATLSGGSELITDLRFAPDGSTMASADMDGVITIWNLAARKPVRTLNHLDFSITAVRYSNDGRLVASVGIDQKIRVWEIATGREIIVHETFDRTILAISFSPDGKWLTWATPSTGALHLLNLNTRQEIEPIPGITAIGSVSFSPNGNWLAVSRPDAEFSLWNMSDLEYVYNSPGSALLAQAELDTSLSLKVSANSFTGEEMTILPQVELHQALDHATDSIFTIISKAREQNLLQPACTPVPIVATLNPFPTSFINPVPPCHNFSTLDARIVESGDSYSGNEVVRGLGRDARIGETVRVRIYLDNGAANNMPAEQAVARNVKVTSWLESSGSEHKIGVSLKSDNTNSISETFAVRTEPNTLLEVVPQSGQIRDWQNQLLKDSVELGGNTYSIGDLSPGFETDLFLYFDVRVKSLDSKFADFVVPPRIPGFDESRVTSAANKGRIQRCPNPPARATLNPFRLSFSPTGETCTNFPPIDLSIADKYSTNEQEWNSPRSVKAGDEFYVSVYVDNGAANNLPLGQTTAKNVQVTSFVNLSVGDSHSIGVSFKGDNTNTVSKTLIVNTQPDEFLEVVPNSGELFDAYNHRIQKDLIIGNRVTSIGDLRPGFQTDIFLRFKVRVVRWVVAQQVTPKQDGPATSTPASSVRNNPTEPARISRDEASGYDVAKVSALNSKGKDNSCGDVPKVPTLNPFPLTFTDPPERCKNYVPLDVRHLNGKYSQSMDEWNRERVAKAGDELRVMVYIDNGAANNLPLGQTVAKNVQVKTSVDTSVGAQHVVSVSFAGTNTNTVSNSVTIRTAPDESLEVVPNSGQLWNYQTALMRSNLALGNNVYSVGDVGPGFATDLFLVFAIRVVNKKESGTSLPTPLPVNTTTPNCILPPRATLNPFPLTFVKNTDPCTNLTPFDLRFVNGDYARNEKEWNEERVAKAGDELYALVYVSNRAETFRTFETIARNVQINTVVDPSVGSTHSISMSFAGEGTNVVSKTLTIRTGPKEYLEVVPFSGALFDYSSRPLLISLQVGNNTYSVGDIPPGLEADLFLRFKIRVRSTEKN